MAIEAITSSGMTGTMPTSQVEHKVVWQSVETVQPEAAQENEAAESFRKTLGAIHDEVSKMKPTSELSTLNQPDAVEAMRNEILPSPYKIASLSPQSGGANMASMGVGGMGGNPATSGAMTSPLKGMDGKNPVTDMQEGVRTMQAGFEHSLMVGLVTQVLGGLTNTTTTLIKQA